MKEEQPLHVEQRASNTKTLQNYKKRLLFQVIAVFSICLLIILERIFYQVIIQREEQILSDLQVSTDLVTHAGSEYLPNQITNGLLQFFGKLSKFRYQFFLLTHAFITMYVAFDSLKTTKIIYVSMGVIYIVSLLQLFYGGARPFWTTNTILSCDCLNSYAHPSIGLILLLFVPYYFFYNTKKKPGQVFAGNMSKNQLFVGIFILVLIGLVQFVNYFTGTIFLLNIALSVVCFLLLIMIAISTNNVLDQAVKKSTIIQVDAKKYVFYWLLFICLLMAFVLIVYSGQDVFLDIDWVRNYIECTTYHDYDQINYRYDQVVGPWFNFLQTASLFAWIGAVFGISFCYRKMPINEWSQGSLKNKLLRVLISNILIIPSWIFVGYLQTGSWIEDIGLNQFIVDAVHYLVLYLWLFGFMPVYVLQKLLKLTNHEGEDFYVILKQRK